MDEVLTSSEYARLILARALRLAADQTPERAQELHEEIVEACFGGDPATIVNMLACTAVEAWGLVASAAGATTNEVLQVVFANWAESDQALRAMGQELIAGKV